MTTLEILEKLLGAGGVLTILAGLGKWWQGKERRREAEQDRRNKAIYDREQALMAALAAEQEAHAATRRQLFERLESQANLLQEISARAMAEAERRRQARTSSRPPSGATNERTRLSTTSQSSVPSLTPPRRSGS